MEYFACNIHIFNPIKGLQVDPFCRLSQTRLTQAWHGQKIPKVRETQDPLDLNKLCPYVFCRFLLVLWAKAVTSQILLNIYFSNFA